MTNILEVQKINRVYEIGKGNRLQVLHDVDLAIGKGAFISVMGASGSGKSTLLYNISGMDRVTSGSIQFDGEELTTLSEEGLSSLRLSRMGFIFQQSNLLKNLNVLDNIILSAYMRDKADRKAVVDKAMKLMTQMGIGEIAGNDITQASGGQLQRAAICRALINEPDIIFGDEPTGALNSKATAEVMDILSGIHHAGATIMLVTHSVKVAAQTERVLYMADGVITGEMELGKFYSSDSLKIREQELSAWLSTLGF